MTEVVDDTHLSLMSCEEVVRGNQELGSSDSTQTRTFWLGQLLMMGVRPDCQVLLHPKGSCIKSDVNWKCFPPTLNDLREGVWSSCCHRESRNYWSDVTFVGLVVDHEQTFLLPSSPCLTHVITHVASWASDKESFIKICAHSSALHPWRHLIHFVLFFS